MHTYYQRILLLIVSFSEPAPTQSLQYSDGLTSGATRGWGGSPGVGAGVCVPNGDGFPRITLSAPGFR